MVLNNYVGRIFNNRAGPKLSLFWQEKKQKKVISVKHTYLVSQSRYCLGVLFEFDMKPHMHGNKHFSLNHSHLQTYQNYELSRQKLGTFLENKVLQKSKFSKTTLHKSKSPSSIFFTEFFLAQFDQFSILKNDFENQNVQGGCS